MKHKTVYLLFIFIGTVTYSQKTLDEILNKYNKNEVPYISVTELCKLQTKGNVVILDSREKNEYNVSHLNSAIFVGYNFFSVENILKLYPNKNTPMVVYCTVGIRSEITSNKLIKTGYTNVYNLYGGIFEWKNKNFKVYNSEETETENVHTFNKEWSKWLLKGVKIFD
jgi:rhodanese-related sulfurtransferase